MYNFDMNYSIKKYLSGYREYIDTFHIYGVSGILEELSVRGTFWNLESLPNLNLTDKHHATSITDRPGYLEICRLAANNKSVLANFKRCHEYRLVLEHVSRSQGQQYLEMILDDSAVIGNLKIITPKEIGNPVIYDYPEIGKVSPTQIRYAKILKDLESIFGKSYNEVIVEVGIGNGGQAWQIANYLHPKEYYLVDLPEVLTLTSKAGEPYKFPTKFHYVAPPDVTATKSDLFISNYAFSELKKKSQKLYLESYIIHAKKGYMLYNHIHDNQDDSYTVEEMHAMIPNSRILEESPKTFDKNFLLVWGAK